MNKEEFLARLGAGLSDLSAPSREEILRDLDDHFQEGLRHGLTEEDIAGRLGSPEELAAALLEEGRRNTFSVPEKTMDKPEGKTSSDPPQGDPFDALAASLADLVDHFSARFSQGRKTWETQDSAGDTSAPRENAFELPLKRIEVALGAMDLRIVSGGGDRVVCRTEKDASSLRFEVRDQVLYIREENRSGISFSFMGIRINHEGEELTLLLPDAPLSLSAHTASGDIHLGDVSLAGCTLGTASGDVTLRLSDLSSLRCGTASGDIDAACEGCGDLTLSTKSGDLRLTAGKAHGPVRLETVSGDIETEFRALSAPLEIHTVSGDANAEAEGFSGAVRGRTVSGDLKVSVSGGPVRASLVTRSGDAEILSGGRPLKGTNLVYGTDGAPCELSSVSGDVTLTVR